MDRGLARLVLVARVYSLLQRWSGGAERCEGGGIEADTGSH